MIIQLFRYTNLCSQCSYTEGTHCPPCYTLAKEDTRAEPSPQLLAPNGRLQMLNHLTGLYTLHAILCDGEHLHKWLQDSTAGYLVV